MDILLTVIYCLIVLSVLVFIHEGGHFVSAKIFGVRVTEFMLGLPGPKLSFKIGETKFGITCILLGGYARVCGMEAGNLKPYLKETLCFVHERGVVSISDVEEKLQITKKQAESALDELVEWGCVHRDKKVTETNISYIYSAADINGYKLGQSREVKDKDKYFKAEYFKQYRSLSFCKRSIIILSGIFVNILFAMIVFVILYTFIGFDIKDDLGQISHVTMQPIESIVFGIKYLGAVISAVVGLLNPVTAVDTVQNSTSLIGIAVISKSAAEQGLFAFLQFMAMISVSLGIMNLLPIPPLDGGRFIIEIVQRITRKNIPEKVINLISIIGISLFILLFIVLMNQDIQRFVLCS